MKCLGFVLIALTTGLSCHGETAKEKLDRLTPWIDVTPSTAQQNGITIVLRKNRDGHIDVRAAMYPAPYKDEIVSCNLHLLNSKGEIILSTSQFVNYVYQGTGKASLLMTEFTVHPSQFGYCSLWLSLPQDDPRKQTKEDFCIDLSDFTKELAEAIKKGKCVINAPST